MPAADHLVVLEDGTPKAVGATLLSSSRELKKLQRAELRPFSPAAAAEAAWVYDDPPRTFFVADSLEQLADATCAYLEHFSRGAETPVR